MENDDFAQTPGSSKKDLENIRRDVQAFLTGESLGIQHNKILKTYMTFLDSVLRQEASAEDLTAIVQDMVSYLTLHFVSEESLMNLTAYPEADHHRLRHRGFLDEVERLVTEIRIGQQTYDALAAAAGLWMLDHERTFDADLAAFLAARPDAAG
ncbi:MAG: hemerythrin family protein [Rhodospirillaceae bacterium]